MLPDNVAQAQHLLLRIQVTGRVVRIADEDGLGARGDQGLECFHIRQAESIPDIGMNGFYRRAAGQRHGLVVGIEGLGDDDLVARIQQAQEGEQHGFGAACRYQNLFRCQVDAETGIIADQGFPEGEDPL